ncbi:substrate binding domain-containing protein [Citrobacter sp. OP27]
MKGRHAARTDQKTGKFINEKGYVRREERIDPVLVCGRLTIRLVQRDTKASFRNFSLWWDLLLEFQQRYPDIHVFCHSSERVVDLFEDGVDVALRMGSLNADDVIAKTIMDVEIVFVASPKLLARYGTPETLVEMARLPVAAWETLNNGFFEWDSGVEKVKYEPFFSTNNLQGLIHYALNGMGVAQLMDFSARPWLESGELVQLLPGVARQSMPLNLVYARRKHPSALVRTYLDFCAEWVGKLK